MSTLSPPVIPREGKLVNVVPVTLKEAALDSPSFRATTLHFSEQIDLVERWLDSYIRANSRLTSELSSLEAISNGILGHVTSPINVTEAVVDHDYAFPAMKRYGESFKDCWIGMLSTLKRFDALVMEPIRNFIQVDLRSFRDVRRILDQTQKQYDHLQARYASQGKSKEPSSIREDAFQLHEARKAYLKASMDFCVQAPQLKLTLEKLLVNTFFDQWREFKTIRENTAPAFTKCAHEMERVKGWTHEMEAGEKVARRDISAARKQIEENVEQAVRPSRELEDYSISTVPYLGSHGPASVDMTKDHGFKPEKQSWLNLRVFTGKPTRTAWVRRWAFLKNGIFGCLVYNTRTGGVEESERIGVLLCSIRPAFQEERRFCFEVKTKSSTILLQAETQKELTEWIGSFEAAKRRALESPSSELPPFAKSTTPDPAFAISQPPAPEFTADVSESLTPNAADEPSILDRASTALDRDGLAIRNSADFSSSRRSTNPDREELGRDHASRIIQKLDIHRKSNTNSPFLVPPSPAAPGGIASLISASHNLLPLGANNQLNQPELEPGKWKTSQLMASNAPHFTLAPATLANPPVPTSMSTAAVIVSSERGIGVGLADSTGAVPTGMMANLWGSSHWGMINHLERGEMDPNATDEKMAGSLAEKSSDDTTRPQSRSPGSRHRQTMSLGDTDSFHHEGQGQAATAEYPSFYPHLLKPHDSQFRLLFPYVPRDESLVLVHRATFSPNDQQDFPGRVFATTRNIYFYSNHFGLVLTTRASLSGITDVTAASGRDCDFLYLHVVPHMGSDIPGRLTIKTFLEPLKLLQKRLNFLIENATSGQPIGLELVFKTLLKLETEGIARSPSIDSWEDVAINTPVDNGPQQPNGAPAAKSEQLLRPGIFIDNDLEVSPSKQGNRPEVSRFRLPSQPVVYEPQGSLHLAAETFYNIGTKALFHVLFGDKSPVWQLSQHQRMARNLKQTPWSNKESSHMRRSLAYQVEIHDLFGHSELADLSDYQIVDAFNDHLCYVVTDKRTPWHLPFRRYFRLVSKIVITHVSKSKCKLAIFTKVEWLSQPWLLKAVIDRKAMSDLQKDALDLIDIVSDQVKKLGLPANTKKAVSMFGNVGRQTDTSTLDDFTEELNTELRRPLKQKRLVPLLLESSGSLLQSAVSSLLLWFWAVLRWAWKVSSANKAILLFLIGSLLVNGFHSYRDTFDWWNERNASNFMARMGVGPNTVLSKAIYLRDMDAAIAKPSGIEPPNSSTCFSVFSENNAIAAETPFSISTVPARDPATRHAAYRLQRTRQRLGSHRHDLLVALRVVNRIEKEVLQAEWENWVERETQRCRMLDGVLNDRDENVNDDDEDAANAKKRFSDRKEQVGRWYKDYCLSCERVHDRMENIRG